MFPMQSTRSLYIPIILSLTATLCLTAQNPILDRYNAGDYDGVVDISAARIAGGDTAFQSYYLKALSEIQLGRTDSAIGTLQLASALFPGETRIRRLLAGQFYEAGDFVRARVAYGNLVISDSSDLSAWLKLAEIASFQQRTGDAVKKLDVVLSLDTSNLSGLMLLGEILVRQDLPKAISCYEKILSIYPENQQASYALGNLYIQTGIPDSAIPVCVKVLDRDSTNIRFHKLLGFANYRAGKTASAVRNFRKAMALGDSTVFTFKYLGISHFLNFDFPGAIEALSVAVEKDTADAEIHFFLGSSLGNTTRKEEAMVHLDRSLELMQPDAAVIARIYSEQGNIMRLEMEYEKAYALYEKAWQAEPTNPVPIYYMASILDNSLHRSREALVDYRRFIEQLDGMPEARREESQIPTLRSIVEDRIELLTEELFFLDEQPVKE